LYIYSNHFRKWSKTLPRLKTKNIYSYSVEMGNLFLIHVQHASMIKLIMWNAITMHYKNVINDINIQAFYFSATLDLTYMADKRLFLSKERTYM